MNSISQVDLNFKIETKINKPDIEFHNARSTPFKIYGVFYENGKFRRMPEAVAGRVSDGVRFLHSNTAGGRVAFKTDSPYVAIHAKMTNIGKMSHFTLAGSVGFDLYLRNPKTGKNEEYFATFVPPYDINDGYESVVDFSGAKLREVVINLPLYSDVTELYIGLSKNAMIQPPTDYETKEPIVYYGSSITQGGCASRAGMSYQAILSRRLSADHINLGFSGNARAEDEMISYVKDLEMSAFVLDYDHNAPSIEHLEKTHEKMFKAVRQAHPKIPIVIMPRPKASLNKDEKKREKIIKATYKNAIKSGDKNVYFLSGVGLTRLSKADGTVDGTHPTDLGFCSMAMALYPILKKALRAQKKKKGAKDENL